MSAQYYRRRRSRTRAYLSRRVDPLKEIREILADKTLHLKQAGTLETLAVVVKAKERALLTAIAAKTQHQQTLSGLEQELVPLCAERARLSEQAGIFAVLFNHGPVVDSLRKVKEQIATITAKTEEVKRQMQYLDRWPEAMEEEYQQVCVAKEKVDKARLLSDNIYAERQKRRQEREQTKAERAIISSERKQAELERKKAQKEADRKELQRLRGIAASVNEKSRERADELKATLKKQFRLLAHCPYCFRPLGKDAELDHIIPVFKGGLSTDENLLFVCRQCNQAKSGKTLAMFLKEMGYNRERAETALEELGKHY